MMGWVLDKEDRWTGYEHRRFLEEARNQGIEILLRDAKDFDIQVAVKGGKSLYYRGHEALLPDFVLPRTGAGSDYYDMAVIRRLERLNVPLINGSEAIAVARDKLHTVEILVYHGLATPKTMLAKFPPDFDIIAEEFQFPLIVKSIAGSRGKGIFLCETLPQMEDLMEILHLSRKENAYYIIQEFVSDSRGRDIRVMIVGARAIGAMLREATEGSFKANISRGGSGRPFELNAELEWLSVEAARVLGLDVAGVDVLFDGEGYKVCEVNSGPGFEGFEKATGLNIPEQILQYAQVRLGGYPLVTTVPDSVETS